MPLARVMQRARTSRDKSNFEKRPRGAAGSMSEIGNVPIFSGSESRFREGPHDAAMIGVINAIIYGRLRALRRAFEPPRNGYPVRAAARKRRFRSSCRSRRRPSLLSIASVCTLRSNFKQIICSSARSGVQLGGCCCESEARRRRAARSIFLHILTPKLSSWCAVISGSR